MLRNAFILILACTCLALSACGSGTSFDRESSKQGDDFCRIVSDVDECGCPATVRCVASADLGTIEVQSWSWGVSNGKIVEQNGDGSVVWVSITKPGECQLTARGVDKDGKDCTTPRHKINCARGHNALPVPLPDGPLDAGGGATQDPYNPGALVRYHDWRWTPGRSYDPEGDATTVQWGILLEADLDGDGEFDVLGKALGDGSVRTADLDGDGKPDLVVLDSKGDDFTVREYYRTKSKEDVYVWKMAIKEQGLPARKKEFTGHVTLIK